jgi:hypothetical protein
MALLDVRASLAQQSMGVEPTREDRNAPMLALRKDGMAVMRPKKWSQKSMTQVNDLTGLKFGRLTVLERAPSLLKSEGRGGYAARWCVRCDCGADKIVYADQLRRGKTKSCGCYNNELFELNRSARSRGKK